MANSAYKDLEDLVFQLDGARFTQFQKDLQHRREVAEHNAKFGKMRVKRQDELATAAGIDPQKVSAAEDKIRHAELPEFEKSLTEIRGRYSKRPSLLVQDAKENAIRSATFAAAGQTQVPMFGASMFTGTPSRVNDGWFELKSSDWAGWYQPTDPPLLRAMVSAGGYGEAKFVDVYAHYTFIPDATGLYDLTVSFAFHGWYYLHAIDSFWTSGEAKVSLDVGITVHQYVDDSGWLQGFDWVDLTVPSEFYGLYDRTTAFSKKSPLRVGDPVVVTVQLRVEAFANGDDNSFAEFNFSDGSANYIQALSLHALRIS